MAIFLTAYDTLVGSGYKRKLESAEYGIQTAIINNQIVIDENDPNVLRIYTHDIADIPQFGHPFMVRHNLDEKIVVDLRVFTRLDKNSGDYVIRINNEATLLINRALLNSIWLRRDPYVLLNISPIPMIVYSGWLSENISKRLALDPREQLNLAIYSAYFYHCLFSDNDEFDEEDRFRIISAISRNLRCSATDVSLILVKVPQVLRGIDEFCEKAEEVIGSVRLKNFNSTLLNQILGNSWFGVNAKELVGVAIEHPPTWIALLLSSYTDRTYKNTILARAAERKASKSATDNFSRAIFNLITQS